MRKGQKRRTWAKTQKLEIIHKHLDEHISVRTLEKENQACHWIKNYELHGEAAFNSKNRAGNPFSALHTGSVYSSSSFYQAHKNFINIRRSMSRAGTPTDYPVIETLNGWLKEEMKIDFNLKEHSDFPSFIQRYIHYFNNHRLSYKLNYKTPVPFRLECGF